MGNLNEKLKKTHLGIVCIIKFRTSAIKLIVYNDTVRQILEIYTNFSFVKLELRKNF